MAAKRVERGDQMLQIIPGRVAAGQSRQSLWEFVLRFRLNRRVETEVQSEAQLFRKGWAASMTVGNQNDV